MANRSYKQFIYSQERMPVMLMGQFAQSGSTGAFATLVNNGITWTAVTMGSAGNSITVALVAGGTAGSEVVTVSGNAISVSIQSTVSTRTQVLTAVQASAAASALISISVASGATAATLLAATPLASGADTVFISNAKDMTLTQIGTGVYHLALQDSFYALLSISPSLQCATAKDLQPQMSANDVTSSSPYINIRTLAGATPTNMASGDIMFAQVMLRNSGS